MSRGSQPTSFFVKGAVALIILFLLTLMMTPAPEVNALRALIIVGLGIVGVKMVFRHYSVNWPPRRN
jgi:galactitol-specific phosphotransferase system IIC component